MTDTIVTALATRRAPAGMTRLQAFARRLLCSRLQALAVGRLELVEDGRREQFGKAQPRTELAVRIEVLDPQFWPEVVFGGSAGAGEAYVHGLWRCDDLTKLVRLLLANRAVLERVDGGASTFAEAGRRLGHWLNRNSRAGSRRNVAAHYDLGNELFELFLDPTLNYSCALFEPEDASLEAASVAKMDAICAKLELSPADHLLEIGTGWGGLAIHAARHYGCRVTTTTISREQHRLATERVRAAGLGDRVTLLLEDYRELSGRYDKLVSVEMVEAVGHQYLDDYFRRTGELLEPHGLMLLQAITIREEHYRQALASVDFIKRHVFPGSFIPSVSTLTGSLARTTDLYLLHLQDIGPHYATTLRHWRERFMARRDEAAALGYPESFARMWEFYLSYCEGGFLERALGNVQMLLAKPAARRAALGYR